MKTSQDFISRLNAYLKSAESAQVPFSEIAREVIDDGMVAVNDSLGEFDVYFDWLRWQFENKKIWPDDSISPPSLRRFGLGVLSGLSSTSPARSFPRARELAQQFLVPRPK